MQSFKQYLKDLQEERLVANEDDAGGGDVVAGGCEADAGDVVDGDGNGGLTSGDVLGKCDHKKDGIFGPGCFHLPVVWTVPVFRYPRKKRKKLKATNSVTINETDGYSDFCESVRSYACDEIGCVNDYLGQIDDRLGARLGDFVEFDGDKSEWIADLDSCDDGQFVVCVNPCSLFAFLYDNGLEDNDREIEAQVRIAIWREIGLALLKWFADCGTYDFEAGDVERERLADEFAKYQIRKYSDVYDSRLNDFVNEVFENRD